LNTCEILVHLTQGSLSELRLLDLIGGGICEIGGGLSLNRDHFVALFDQVASKVELNER